MKSALIRTFLGIAFLTLLSACGSSQSVLSGNFTEFEGSFDGISVEFGYYSDLLQERVVLGSGVVEDNDLEVDISYDKKVPRWATLVISNPDDTQSSIGSTAWFHRVIVERGAHYTLNVIAEAEFLFRVESDGKYAHLFAPPIEIELEEHDLRTKLRQFQHDESNGSLPSDYDDSLDITIPEPSEHARALDWENMTCADYAGEYEQSWRSKFFSPDRREDSEAFTELIKQFDEFFEREYHQPARTIFESSTDQIEKLLIIERGFPVSQDKTIQILKELASEFPDYVIEERIQPRLTELIRGQERRLANEALKLGSLFPSFDITLMDQSTTPLSSILQKNQIVVLELWENYCESCIDGFNQYKNFYSKYVNLGFEIVSLSLETDRDAWLEKTEELRLPWTNSLAPGGYEGEISNKLGIRSPRANFVLDSEGCILKRNLTPNELHDFLGARLGS